MSIKMQVCMSITMKSRTVNGMSDFLPFGMVLWLHCLGQVCKKLAFGFDDVAHPARGHCHTPIKKVVLRGGPDTSHLAAS